MSFNFVLKGLMDGTCTWTYFTDPKRVYGRITQSYSTFLCFKSTFVVLFIKQHTVRTTETSFRSFLHLLPALKSQIWCTNV